MVPSSFLRFILKREHMHGGGERLREREKERSRLPTMRGAHHRARSQDPDKGLS